MKFIDMISKMRPNSLEKADEQYHDEDEAQSFLSNGKEDGKAKLISWRFMEDRSLPWKIATVVLAVSLGLSLFFGQRVQHSPNYETGFITELRQYSILEELQLQSSC